MATPAEKEITITLREKEIQILNFVFFIMNDLIRQNGYPSIGTSKDNQIYSSQEFSKIFDDLDEKIDVLVHENKLCVDPHCGYDEKQKQLKKML